MRMYARPALDDLPDPADEDIDFDELAAFAASMGEAAADAPARRRPKAKSKAKGTRKPKKR